MSLALWSLLAIGLFGAFRISYTTLISDNDCPDIGGIFICYLVLLGYLLMTIGQFIGGQTKNYWFYIGWFSVFTFALFGTILELINGQTCPKSSSGMPMCYVSLLLATTIVVLFFMSANMNQKSGADQ